MKNIGICKANINLHVVRDVSRMFSTFQAANWKLSTRNFRRQTVYAVLYFVTLVLVPSYYKNAFTYCSKGISEENQWRI